MLEWLPPYEVTVSSKRKLGDLIFGTYVGFLASKRFKEVYEQSDLTGLSNFRKVDLYFRGKLLEDKEYYYSDIALIHAHIDLNYVELETQLPFCDTCQLGRNTVRKIDAIFFTDPEQLTKDIFFSTSLDQVEAIVSESFKRFIEANEFINAELVETGQYRWGPLLGHHEDDEDLDIDPDDEDPEEDE
ncbi:MAG: hypothetical protein ROO73_00690 [Roseivirga sp.]